MYYTGSGHMKLFHKGMRISGADWQAFLGTIDNIAAPALSRCQI